MRVLFLSAYTFMPTRDDKISGIANLPYSTYFYSWLNNLANVLNHCATRTIKHYHKYKYSYHTLTPMAQRCQNNNLYQ